MKRTYALAVLLASGLALNATAQTPASTAAPVAVPNSKVAVIAFQVAVAQTNEGQRNLGDVQRKFEPKRAQLKTLSDEVDSLKKQLQTQGDKLTPAQSASLSKSVDEKSKQLQRSYEDAQNDYQQETGEVFNTLASKVFEVVDAYAKAQGFTQVLDVSAQQQGQIPTVLWFADSTNITQQVVDAYNAKSGVPAPPAGPVSAPTPHVAPKPASGAGAAAPKK